MTSSNQQKRRGGTGLEGEPECAASLISACQMPYEQRCCIAVADVRLWPPASNLLSSQAGLTCHLSRLRNCSHE